MKQDMKWNLSLCHDMFSLILGSVKKDKEAKKFEATGLEYM